MYNSLQYLNFSTGTGTNASGKAAFYPVSSFRGMKIKDQDEIEMYFDSVLVATDGSKFHDKITLLIKRGSGKLVLGDISRMLKSNNIWNNIADLDNGLKASDNIYKCAIVHGLANAGTAGQTSPVVNVFKTVVDQAQCNALNTQKIMLIPAPGAGKANVVIGGTMIVDRAANNTNAVDLYLDYDSADYTNPTYRIYNWRRFHYNVATDGFYNLTSGTSITISSRDIPDNLPVYVGTTGAVANNCLTKITFELTYYVVDL
tara:strand:- start:419 stop:1195 length:777 start_codon:yes stop_codon:yes gene_type:complete